MHESLDDLWLEADGQGLRLDRLVIQGLHAPALRARLRRPGDG